MARRPRPVAALFAIMTKVGVYAVARMYTLVFGADGAWRPTSRSRGCRCSGLATIALAAVGALAARDMRGLVGYLVIASAGTLLTALGLGSRGNRRRGAVLPRQQHAGGRSAVPVGDRIGAQRGAHGDALAPGPFGASAALLGAPTFVAAIAVCSLPPLAGFLGKSLLLAAALDTGYAAWVWAVVLASGLAIIISVARAGSRIFWKPYQPAAPEVTIATSSVHAMAMGWLFAALLANTVAAGRCRASPCRRAAVARPGSRTSTRCSAPARWPAALPIREILGDKPTKDAQ